jgi:Zn-dependent protease with chaperone function
VDDPIRLLLTNAVVAGLIALLAWAASRTIRRQAVVHGLWLLALVKLVTPPIAPWPVVPGWADLALTAPGPTVVPIPLGPREGSLAETSSQAPTAVGPAAALVVSPPVAGHAKAAAHVATPVLPLSSAGPGPGLRATAGVLIGAGVLAISLLSAWRFARFGRSLRCARPAPDAVAERAERLAGRLGLRRCPPVLLVPAPIPPMLWPHRGGPRLLLPADLVPDLRGDELDALLAHELAHVRRRDHWVRLVELAATALFWWYPITWWARRALRRAEERCCDEWVLRLLPRSAEAYANGLLKSLTFVAERPGPLPSMASGAGPCEDLEARLKEILMTRPVPRLAAPIRVTLAAAAALGLAVFPTRADSPATATESPVAAEAPPAAETPAPAARPAPRPAAKRAPAARPATTPRPGAHSPVAARPAPAAPLALASHPGLAPLAALTPRPALAPMATPDPTPQAQPAPAPAIAARDQRRDPARRALDDQRRAIEEQRRQLHQQELELAREQAELEAQAEQAELRATADRLRADGNAHEAARIERQLEMTGLRMDLQRRQLGLEAERFALQAKLEAEMRAHEDRLVAVEEGAREGAGADARRAVERAEKARQQAEGELEKKQQAIETEMLDAEKQMRALEAEHQVRALREATDDLVRSLADQIEALMQAGAQAPVQKAAVEHEIQRLQAALDALRSGGTPKALPRKSSRPQP